MDTTKLRKFAQFARSTLIDQVAARMDAVLSDGSRAQREHPKAFKKLEALVAKHGPEHVVEKVAYIWFNRFTALRYMDVNGFSPVRVVSPSVGQFQPEILSDAKSGSINEQIVSDITRQKVLSLLDGRIDSPDPQGEAYRLLVVAACNYWHEALPFMFERIDDFTELLMPSDLQSNASILAYLREAMTPDVCEDVEIIGWLYQFYISEKKDQVFAGLKKNQKITAENIPAATQLFTPHWIVSYLVENSLGRLWLLNRPQSRLAERMDYYIAPEEPETDFLKVVKPEEIKICDPAAGSGHMLTYAFDLLYAIYEEEGYDATEIPALILTHNLTGVEIDDRAGALAAFALAMKAAGKLGRRRFLRMEARPDICVLQEHRFKISEFNDFLAELGCDLNVDRLAQGLTKTPLMLNEFWHCVSRYLKHAEASGFENIVESATHVFDVAIESELALFDEASQNPFVLAQIQDARSELLSIAASDKATTERKQREAAFKKHANSPNISERLSDIGKAYAKHKNDTTYRMALDALVERVEEATKSPEAHDTLAGLGRKLSESIAFHGPLWATIRQFEQAKNFGSLIVPKLRDPAETLRVVEARDFGGDLLLKEVQERVIAVLRMAEALSPKYHVVVANPPYMGASNANTLLSDWSKVKFPASKADLYSMFMERNLALACRQGLVAMVNMQSWMFLSSFEKLRTKLLTDSTILTMAHLGERGFDTIGGAVVSTTAFVLWKKRTTGGSGDFLRLVEGGSEKEKAKQAISGIATRRPPYFFQAGTDTFESIPGTIIAYWLSDSAVSAFLGSPFSSKSTACIGMQSGDNDKHFRFWHEVTYPSIDWSLATISDAKGRVWSPLQRGGSARKWFGSESYVANMSNEGREILRTKNAALRNVEKYFKESVCWNRLSQGNFQARYVSAGHAFDDLSPFAVPGPETSTLQNLALMNSKAFAYLLSFISSGFKTEVGHVSKVPLPTVSTPAAAKDGATAPLSISRADWDAYETSWDFNSLPLLSPDHRGDTLEDSYATLRVHWQSMTEEMQRLEEENNRIFIEAYGLQEELTPEVPIEEITLTCNPAYSIKGDKTDAARDADLRKRTMEEFLSYAVGCMFGRYCLDAPGLILANQGETLADYLDRVPEPTFMPDEDNVIPVLDENWFPDDITERFRLFLRVTFGEAHFRENLKFIEDALGKNGKPRSLRDYFTKDFYADHVKRYKKRPIYWMFSSPKGTFNALIYMHRYRPDTVSVLLNDYLREFITKLEGERVNEQKRSDDPTETKANQTKALKKISVLSKQINELNEWEREVIFPLAQRKIEIDLDKGVKANYPAFGSALKKITGLS